MSFWDFPAIINPWLGVIMPGPRTDKSLAMRKRIARMSEEQGVNPAEILRVTITRVSAEVLHREPGRVPINAYRRKTRRLV